jgi:hypothetical protein
MPRGRFKGNHMEGQMETAADAAKPKSAEPRQRSTIGFPYMDLASATELAEAIFRNVGNGECDDDQLAAWSNQSSKSSTFRVQIYAARTFGLLAAEGSRHKLTELGLAVVDPQRAAEAKVRSFLTVPLYSAVYERFKGGNLPPAAALEREMVGLGVAPKQKDRARQVFERSAEQSGFFAHGRDRLVQPGFAPVGSSEKQPPLANADKYGSGGGGSGGGDDSLDPVVSALIKKLPGKGKDFAVEARVRWLQMMEMAFQDAYGEAGVIEIKKA